MTLDQFLETLNDDLDVELAQVITFARGLQNQNDAMREAIQCADHALAADGYDLTDRTRAKLQPFITP